MGGIRETHAADTVDQRIDIGLELKNIKMNAKESINDYIVRAKNIASRSASIGFPIEGREVVYHVVRALHERFEKVAAVLRAQ